MDRVAEVLLVMAKDVSSKANSHAASVFLFVFGEWR